MIAARVMVPIVIMPRYPIPLSPVEVGFIRLRPVKVPNSGKPGLGWERVTTEVGFFRLRVYELPNSGTPEFGCEARRRVRSRRAQVGCCRLVTFPSAELGQARDRSER